MDKEFENKVVLISGVARGQGRSHALAFAARGAIVVGLDVEKKIESLPLETATAEDLKETAELVEAAGGRIETHIADVRDGKRLEAVVADAVGRHGGIDIVLANAGVGCETGPAWEATERGFRDVLDVNVVGAWNLARVAIPSMIARGRGCIVFTSSGAAVKGLPNLAPYVASKHALVGLAGTMARELGQYQIRVNTVQPGNVDTPLLMNDTMIRLFVPDEKTPSKDTFRKRASRTSPMGVPWVEANDITEAVLWLASDHARYVTGATIAVDAGSGIA